MTEQEAISRLRAVGRINVGADQLLAIEPDLHRFIGQLAIDEDWDACAADTWQQCPALITADLAFGPAGIGAHVPRMPWPESETGYRTLVVEAGHEALEKLVVLAETVAALERSFVPSSEALRALSATIAGLDIGHCALRLALAYVRDMIDRGTTAAEIRRTLTELASIGNHFERRTEYHDVHDCLFGSIEHARSLLSTPLAAIARWRLEAMSDPPR